ncbi:MAG: L,D-transpeptidase family protein [Bdellovibrionota bacterium]
MSLKTDISFLGLALVACFASAFVSGTAGAAQYSTSYNGNSALHCPSLPPDQLRIVRQMPVNDPCVGKGTSLYVSSTFRTLFICENGVAVDNYDVSLGKSGIGKTTKDDNKTPIGTYSLGSPRESEKFGLFIPVGYPTKAQREQGFTGEAIGIHGPARQFRCIGFLNVVFDWTAGCMAVADDGFIMRIARWVDAHPKAKITIR